MMFKPQLLFQDGHEYIDRDGNPYLRPHRIRGNAIERFDSEMLFYPFEEQFYTPSELVQLCYNQSRKFEIVCEKGETLSSFLVEIDNPPQFSRIVLRGFLNGEHDSLIASEPGRFVHRTRIQPSYLGVAFRPGEKECRSHIDSVEPLEVQIPPVDKVKCTGLQDEVVQGIYIVNRSVCDAYEDGNGASDVEERMHFHCSLGFPETSPRKKIQTKVYGSGVESIDRVVEIQTEVLVRIKPSCLHDENMCELRIYPPVPVLVGICNRAFPHRAPYSHMIEFSSHCIEARVDVPQTLPVCQSSKGQAIILVEAIETPCASIAIVFVDTFLKLIRGEKFHDLSEDCFAVVH